MTLKEAAAIRQERVIAEKDADGWLVMWPDGNVDRYASKRGVLAAIKTRIGKADILVTTVVWQ